MTKQTLKINIGFYTDKGPKPENEDHMVYETADANAKVIMFALPEATEDANNVPVAVFGDRDVFGVDLGVLISSWCCLDSTF